MITFSFSRKRQVKRIFFFFSFRQLESTLDELGDQVRNIALSRNELVKTTDEKSHLLLASLLAEQTKLEKRQEQLQALLERASLEHSQMAQSLIERLDAFRSEDMVCGPCDHRASTASLSAENQASRFTRIQLLSDLLSRQVYPFKTLFREINDWFSDETT